jgi:hypothetical protein
MKTYEEEGLNDTHFSSFCFFSETPLFEVFFLFELIKDFFELTLAVLIE